jgi:tRNA (guanine10-N2)-dimethyltransferase
VSEKLFFIISGEHPTLPEAELKAILEAENCQFHLLESAPKLSLVEAPQSCLEVVSTRSSMCTISGVHVLECPNDRADIEKAIKESGLSSALKPGDSFSVRVVKVGRVRDNRSSEALEAYVGKMVQQTVQGLSVDLVRPRKSLLGIVYDGKFILGIEKYRREPGGFSRRRPRQRPVFHPSTMPPKLARCMVNLARPRKGDLILDPFCGVGGILIEADLIGCRTLGCDIRLKKVQDSLVNMKYFGLEPVGMVLADARAPPFKEIDTIVTDPPYGTAASTHGSTTREILKRFFRGAYEILSPGSCICIGSPRKAEINSLGNDAGFDLVELHEVYVHRSLTRVISVFRRK